MDKLRKPCQTQTPSLLSDYLRFWKALYQEWEVVLLIRAWGFFWPFSIAIEVPRQGCSLRTQICLLSCFFVLFQLGLYCCFPISLRYWLDLKSTDIIWNMSDTGWIKAAIGSVFSSWLQGACVFVHRMAQFDTNTFLDVSHYFKLHIVF